jgi:hypothetical protein
MPSQVQSAFMGKLSVALSGLIPLKLQSVRGRLVRLDWKKNKYINLKLSPYLGVRNVSSSGGNPVVRSL